MKSNKGSSGPSWDRRIELEAIRAETRKEAKEAVDLAKKLGWRPAKAKKTK